MRTRTKQSGFSILELSLIVVVVAALGLVGWAVYQNQQASDKAQLLSSDPAPTPATTATNISPAPEIKSTDDLDKALQALEQNDPSTTNSSDSKLLDSQTGTF